MGEIKKENENEYCDTESIQPVIDLKNYRDKLREDELIEQLRRDGYID